MVEYIKDETGWHAPLDWRRLVTEGRRSIYAGDGSDLAYVNALFHAFISVPQGHQGFYIGRECGRMIPLATLSQRGVCGQPHTRGVVVTNVKGDNPLGLKKGDLVTRVAHATGSALLDLLSERPMCTASRPSVSNRNAVTATTFSDLLAEGDEIEIESPDGSKRTFVIPRLPLRGELRSALSCMDPFSRPPVVVASELRDDGIGVIRLPSFSDPEQELSPNPTQAEVDLYREKFEAKILTAFDKVKSAPAIVWDIRGNGGGYTLVGLDIVSGFPGARPGPLSYCEARSPKTEPPAFDTSFRYAELALTPRGPFAYDGKVAVLIDGMDYSAADYFPLAVKSRTSAILVGAASAGAYGGTSLERSFAGPPSFDISVDVNRCSSADDATPLEGKGTVPHVAVEYEPRDLAAGKDTVLEKAASLVK